MFRASEVQPNRATHPARPHRTGRGSRQRAASIRGRPPAGLGRRAIARIGLIAMLAASAACTVASLSVAAASDPRAGIRAEGPGGVFHSIETAAIDALATAHLTATPRDRERLRVGTIYRVANGFSYTEPQRSAASSPLMRQSVRYPLRSIDVASYVIWPRSGEARSKRSNETWSEEWIRIVDELDPAHRPLYLLTPSLDIVRYSRGGKLHVLTSLNDLRLADRAAAEITAMSTRVFACACCGSRALQPAVPASAH